MFLAKSPEIIKKYYPRLIWDIPNEENKIYLTFDDGPTPEVTNWVLDLLAHYKIKATFFCLGNNAQKHPKIFNRIIAESHAVGNHSFSHVNGWYADDDAYLEDVEKCNKVFESTLFRPPYGRIKKSQIKEIVKAYKIVMWDVLSGDFDTKTSPKKCLTNVIKNTKSGSVIVYHDSVKAYDNVKNSLPQAIEYLLKEGFVFDVLK